MSPDLLLHRIFPDFAFSGKTFSHECNPLFVLHVSFHQEEGKKAINFLSHERRKDGKSGRRLKDSVNRKDTHVEGKNHPNLDF